MFHEAKKNAEDYDSLPAEFSGSSALSGDLVIAKKDIPMSQEGAMSGRIESFIDYLTGQSPTENAFNQV